MEALDTIFLRHNSDKDSRFHNYTRQYENMLAHYRDKPIKYLEIGVFGGESLRAMREVFPHASCIVGLDIQPECTVSEDLSKKIFVEIGDGTDKTFLTNVTQKYGNFDVILDDGSHVNTDIIKTFETLFPLLNDGGVYIVEDTICYKLASHLREGAPNHLQYFFQCTPFLNQWRKDDSTSGVRDHCVDPFKIQKKTDNALECMIDKIEYGCSYIAIHKKVRTHWIR